MKSRIFIFCFVLATLLNPLLLFSQDADVSVDVTEMTSEHFELHVKDVTGVPSAYNIYYQTTDGSTLSFSSSGPDLVVPKMESPEHFFFASKAPLGSAASITGGTGTPVPLTICPGCQITIVTIYPPIAYNSGCNVNTLTETISPPDTPGVITGAVATSSYPVGHMMHSIFPDAEKYEQCCICKSLNAAPWTNVLNPTGTISYRMKKFNPGRIAELCNIKFYSGPGVVYDSTLMSYISTTTGQVLAGPKKYDPCRYVDFQDNYVNARKAQPTTETPSTELSLLQNLKSMPYITNVSVFDMQGRNLLNLSPEEAIAAVDHGTFTDLVNAQGVYLLKIQTVQGHQLVYKMLAGSR